MASAVDANTMMPGQADDSDAIRPLHVVMIGLVVMTVAGGLLLLSAAEPTAPVDGAIEWHEGSVLRAVVALLCLNYQLPTDYAGAVKGYILGLGSGLALIAIGVAVVARSRSWGENGREAQTTAVPRAEAPTSDVVAVAARHRRRAHIAPLIAAQVLASLYLLWSFASSRWSQAADLALGGSILLSIHFLWAMCIGNGLSPTSGRVAARIVLGLTLVTACISIWYFYGRKPLRADFPVGNPLFLGAALIPGVLLAISVVGEQVVRIRSSGLHATGAVMISLCVFAFAVMLWAIRLADSRAVYGGLLLGAVAMLFFAVRGRKKWIPVAIAVMIGVAGWIYISATAESYSPTGRSASLRLRSYARDFAWQMFLERPLQGHGQGGFVLEGDSFAAGHVLSDPEVFQSRITHAHNEWAEVLADLGSVGFVLVAGALLLTFHAGMVTLAMEPPPAIRWPLIGLLASLVALVAEESFSVGLRVPGVGTMFYTILGLIWAIASYRMSGAVNQLSRTRIGRGGTCILGIGVGILILAVAQEDFSSARYVYRVAEASRRGDYDEAIDWAHRAAMTTRLNPQRALVNYYRLCEMHLRTADSLRSRARDRKQRAMSTEPPDTRLLALAQADLYASDEHCERASTALKSLVVRAPDFINQGRLGYWLNVIRAANAEAKGDHDQERAFLAEATRSIRRELGRQPFNPSVATEFVRSKLDSLEGREVLEVLARPLRYERLSGPYLDLLQKLALHEAFDAEIQSIVDSAGAVESPSNPVEPSTTGGGEGWMPEKLRLAASIAFLRGEYGVARDLLQRAVALYRKLPVKAPVGWASCHGELAVCQFFLDPTQPAPALASAAEALELAPESRVGRELAQAVLQRMIEFQLAAGNENRAMEMLGKTAPPAATKSDVLQELGRRYARMCESLLRRREAGGVLRTPPADLAPVLRRWIDRALELDPGDAAVHYLAADLAFYAKDDEATVGHLNAAMEYGLPVETVGEFLQLAVSQRPESEPLQLLWKKLTSGGQPVETSRSKAHQMPQVDSDLPGQRAVDRSD